MHLDILEKDRIDWWNSDKNKQRRRQWTEGAERSDRENMTKLQTINNDVNGMIQTASGQLGRFAKWTIGVQDGLEG